MRITSMWGIRRGFEGHPPELMEAWDEYSIDSFSEGFEKACDTARKSWGADLVEWRMIELDVDDNALLKAFFSAVLTASVASSTTGRPDA